MVDTCTVTWTARDFNFGTLASARLVFMPRDSLKLLGWSNALYVPNRIEVLSDGSGAGSVSLVPGYYTLHVTSYSGTATAVIAVPDEAAATIGECIDQTLSFPPLSELQAILADAEAAAISANAALDSFDDRYLGSKSANPVLDNDGAALLTGALYFNTVASEMRVYTGVAWVAAYVNDSTYVPLAGGAMTGALAVPSGSAGAPSISISGDTDTGVWSPGANALAISTGATERLRIDASGNVGIGISSPATKLHVLQTNPAIRITRTADFFYGQLTADGFAAYSNTNDNAPIIFKTSIVERLRIDASGNVGIGTSSPAAKLVVNGASALASVPAAGSKVGLFVATVGTQDYGLISGALINGSYFFQSQATDGTPLTYPILLNPNGGNVVIGTSASGASKLRISGLPTSSAGLSAGDVWNDGGTLKIA